MWVQHIGFVRTPMNKSVKISTINDGDELNEKKGRIFLNDRIFRSVFCSLRATSLEYPRLFRCLFFSLSLSLSESNTFLYEKKKVLPMSVKPNERDKKRKKKDEKGAPNGINWKLKSNDNSIDSMKFAELTLFMICFMNFIRYEVLGTNDFFNFVKTEEIRWKLYSWFNDMLLLNYKPKQIVFQTEKKATNYFIMMMVKEFSIGKCIKQTSWPSMTRSSSFNIRAV